jgi:nucleoside-diphosphate-sugar epimerase
VVGFDIRGAPSIDAMEFFARDDSRFDLAIHAAASIPSAEGRAKNAMPVAGNLALDSLYFQWLLRTRPRWAIYFSSSAAYPIHLNVPGHALREDDIDLDDITEPDSMYGLTKLVGEIQAREVRRQGQHVLVVRPQSGYGPDQSHNYPFRAILERVKRREDPLRVWGSGNQARDFVHVEDIVTAVMRMVEDGATGPYNLGTGIATTMRELAQLMAAAQPDYDPQILCDPSKPDGAAYRYASVERMRDYLATPMSLEDGIEGALRT